VTEALGSLHPDMDATDMMGNNLVIIKVNTHYTHNMLLILFPTLKS
jgi:hypothetical protein